MASKIRTWSDDLKKSEAELKQEIAGIPAKVKALSSKQLAEEHAYFSSRGLSCEYDMLYSEAVSDRYYAEFGDFIEQNPIGRHRLKD